MNVSDKIYDLSMIWSKVKEVFPYFGKINFDWDELYYSYLDKVMKTESEQEFHDLMTEFVDCLGDGHTKYVPPMPYRKTKKLPPPEKPSFIISEEGILEIKINEFMSDYSEMIRGLLLEYPNIKEVVLDIRDNIGGNTHYAAKVAELFISGTFHGCRKWTRVYRGIDAASASQYAGISEERIQKYIDDGLCTQEEVDRELKILAGLNFEEYTDSFGFDDNVAIYDGPMKILISHNTISAAEDFTAMFKSNHRAVIVGEATYGSTGTPYIIKLRCGGHAQCVSVGYKLFDGTEFIGIGIKPDAYV